MNDKAALLGAAQYAFSNCPDLMYNQLDKIEA
jgi:hypothetical protein